MKFFGKVRKTGTCTSSSVSTLQIELWGVVNLEATFMTCFFKEM